MRKKVIIILAGVLVLTSFSVGVLSKGLVEKIEAELRGDFTVYVDGVKQNFKDVNGNKVDPILYDGTTYLPVRAIGELMGKKVYWYQDEKKIELVDDNEEPIVKDADVVVNNSKKEENKKPEAVNNGQAKITLDEAKAIALKKAGVNENEANFTKAKLDYDDGRLYYEIDFKVDKVKYDAEIDAVTGEVVEWEVEGKNNPNNGNNKPHQNVIDEAEAKAIALKKAGLKENEVVFTKAKLDYDDGRQVYEIEFRKDRIEYEAEIDAKDGTIIEWNVDKD